MIVWVGPGRQPPRAARSAGMAAARRESVMAKQKVKIALQYMMLVEVMLLLVRLR